MLRIEILRLNEVIQLVKRSKTMLYVDQQKGHFPNKIDYVGARASGYLKHEVEAVLAARAAGYNNDEIKKLVSDLYSQRQELLKSILSSIPSMGESI